jgi:hypothetical protein
MNNNFLSPSKNSNNPTRRLRLARLSQILMILVLSTSLIGIPAINVKAARRNAGTWSVTASSFALCSADAGNYTLAAQPTPFDTTHCPKALTITGVVANDKTYDGTDVATLDLSAAALVGVIGSDDVTIDSSAATGAFASPNAGTWPVTVSGFALGGADAGKYTLAAQPTVPDASITKATLTVQADNISITEGDPVPSFPFNYNGFVNGEDASVLDTQPVCGVDGPHTDPGVYTISCSGGADDNYDFNYLDGTLTINATEPNMIDISLSNASVEENQPVGTTVGTLTTYDPEPGDTFTYTFCGGTDDASFSLAADLLKTAEVFDFESKNSYDICIQSDDDHGCTYQKDFTISIIDGPDHLPVKSTFRSQAAYDGWLLEKYETSNKGGESNKDAKIIALGDNKLDRQYRSILSFDTASLPDNAVITQVTLKLKRKSVVGTNPFTTHGKLLVDVRKGAFGGDVSLQVSDFQAKANKNRVGAIANKLRNGWYTTSWKGRILTYINQSGLTQLRLRFANGDNDDRSADLLKFYSGNAIKTDRPKLIIEYYVP